MNTYNTKNLVTLMEEGIVKDFDKSSLLIIDIDGVFFPSIFSFRMVTGIVDPDTIQAFEILAGKVHNTWIFTDRPYWTSWFPYTRQLRAILGKNTATYASAKEFLNANVVSSNAIIFNAQKKSAESEQVVIAASENFQKVFYIAAQDFSWIYKDLELLEQLKQEGRELKNVHFIDIRHHAKDTK